MQLVRRIVAIVTVLMAVLAYVWFAAVGRASEVRRRKAARRR